MTIIRHSIDDDGCPIVDIQGVYFGYESALKLRDELNQLMPPEKPEKLKAALTDAIGLISSLNYSFYAVGKVAHLKVAMSQTKPTLEKLRAALEGK